MTNPRLILSAIILGITAAVAAYGYFGILPANAAEEHAEHAGHAEEPGAHAEEPGAHAEEPGTHAEEPGAHAEEPGAHAEEPGAHAEEPGAHAEEPGAHAEEPGAHAEEPGAHAGHAHEGGIALTPAQMTELGITTATAGPGRLSRTVTLPGEVRMNEDRTAHVVPRLSGVVREVFKSVGDYVRTGERLAVIESRELADAKADYLAARARLALADQVLQREENLWQKKISAEQDYLQAKQAREEARIAVRTTSQKLRALGLPEAVLENVLSEDDGNLTRFDIFAPFDGAIIQRHITLGEYLEANADCFLIADLSTVWVDVNVNKKDLQAVQPGQSVTISAQDGLPPATAAIAFVAPVVGAETRTAVARIVMPNDGGVWRPGLFVDVAIAVAEKEAPITVARNALVTINEKNHVFVQTDKGFEPREVQTGSAGANNMEIVSGMNAGDVYAAEGAFTLKAEMGKAALAEAGHVH